MSRRSSRPASSGSTAPTCSTPPAASAAIAKAVSAARAAARACTNISPKSCRSAPRSSPPPQRRATAVPAEERRLDRPHGKAVHRRQAGAARRQLFLRRARPQGHAWSARSALGNRKDIRDAVSAARACKAWPEATGYNRSQVLYFLAENLSIRADEFAARIAATDRRRAEGRPRRGRPVGRAAVRLRRHGRQVRRPRPPAAGPRRDAGAARAGRRDRHRRARRRAAARPGLADRPGAGHGQHGRRGSVASGIRWSPPTSTRSSKPPTCRPAPINIVTGKAAELAAVLAKHDDVDGLWLVADAATCKAAEADSIGNLKRVWTSGGHTLDWTLGKARRRLFPPPRRSR